MSAFADFQAVQRLCGLPETQVDGFNGAISRAAFEALGQKALAEYRQSRRAPQIVNPTPADGPIDDGLPDGFPVDDRSEENIATLHPRVRPLARQLIRNALAAGIVAKVISGNRTYAEQDALYARGGVTRARGGYSNHNFGLALDLGIFENGKYLDDSPLYRTVAKIGKALGLSWGGDWTSFQDEPHYELRPPWAVLMSENEMLAELRRRRAARIDAFT